MKSSILAWVVFTTLVVFFSACHDLSSSEEARVEKKAAAEEPVPEVTEGPREAAEKNKANVTAGPCEEGHRGRVLVIGADGLDLKVIDELAAAGELPNLLELLEKGAHGVMVSEREMRSPALWTTMATGRPRSVHGIYDFVTGSRLWPKKLRDTERRLVTSGMRRVPAIWNIASDKGLEVGVVGWLNTWPAEEVKGIMVAPVVALGSSKQVTIKGAVYPDEIDQVYPAERWKEIRSLIVTAEDVDDELAAEFADKAGSDLLGLYPILRRYEHGLRWSLAHTLSMRNITLHIIEKDKPDLTMVYFEGSDSLAHRYWLFRQPRNEIIAQLREADLPTEGADELARKYGKVVEQYYMLLDEVIGELVDAFGENGQIIIMSDHGFGKRTGRFPVNKSVPFSGQHRIEGTIIAAGEGVAEGERVYGATQYDVTPTLLELLGIESDMYLEGSSLVDQIIECDDGVEEEEEEAKIEDPGVEVPYSEEELERLRSLGYVE